MPFFHLTVLGTAVLHAAVAHDIANIINKLKDIILPLSSKLHRQVQYLQAKFLGDKSHFLKIYSQNLTAN